MKHFNLLAIILILSFACSVKPTTINGRFIVQEVDSSKISVLLQINTNTSSVELGGSTLVFRFDTTALHFPEDPINNIDYTFLNFSDGYYSIATVTRPVKNQIWVNIDLPYANSNNGTVVATDTNWTDIVQIYFSIEDSNQTANFLWLTNSLFWGVFDADNSTLWEAGQFENFPTSVDPGSENLLSSFELSQNYPNPFNPSTKIKFAIPSGEINSPVHVKLKVYDILGNEVTTLVDEEKEPGSYEIEFSAINRSSTLASGIYIYTFQSGDFFDSKKMVLLK